MLSANIAHKKTRINISMCFENLTDNLTTLDKLSNMTFVLLQYIPSCFAEFGRYGLLLGKRMNRQNGGKDKMERFEAKNIEDAKSEFWNIVMEDKAVLSLEVEEVE